jgi:hypothetical protein
LCTDISIPSTYCYLFVGILCRVARKTRLRPCAVGNAHSLLIVTLRQSLFARAFLLALRGQHRVAVGGTCYSTVCLPGRRSRQCYGGNDGVRLAAGPLPRAISCATRFSWAPWSRLHHRPGRQHQRRALDRAIATCVSPLRGPAPASQEAETRAQQTHIL